MSQLKPQTVGVRLPGELIQKLDAIAASESARTGYEIGRAELIRSMLSKATAEHEAAHLASKDPQP